VPAVPDRSETRLVLRLKTPGCRSECGMTDDGRSLLPKGGWVGAGVSRLRWDAAWNGSARGADSGALHFDGVYEYAKKM